MGRPSSHRRLRTYQHRNDFAQRHRRSARCRLAFARGRRHRSPQSCRATSRSHRNRAHARASAASGGPAMIPSGRPAKILLIDSNVYFAKKLGDALKREGFEVISSTQAAFALTTLEYDAPAAIVCATNLREMGALEIAKIIHGDP